MRYGKGFVCTRTVDGQTRHVSAKEARLLNSLATFVPLSDHAAILFSKACEAFLKLVVGDCRFGHRMTDLIRLAVQSKMPYVVTGLRNVFQSRLLVELEHVEQKGLLISETDFIASLHNGVPVESKGGGRITRICIPTCRRPDRLLKCLSSFARSLNLWERRDTIIVVMDDSRDLRIEDVNREAIRRAAARQPIPIRHFDMAWRARFVDLLSRKASVPTGLLRFALAPQSLIATHGAARNVLTLLTSGQRVLETDDDTRCLLSKPGKESADIAVSGGGDPCETHFYGSHRQNIQEHPTARDVDVLAIHEAYLGRSIRSTICNSGTVRWENVTPEVLLNIQLGSGRIGITQTGSLGDCGLYSSAGFLMSSSAATLQRASSSDDSLETLIGSREVFRAARCGTLSRNQYFQAMSHGMDNTRLMPPYFPIGRNEDRAFGALCVLSDSGCWVCHLPWAIRHCTESGRRYEVDYKGMFSRVRVMDIVQLCTESLWLPHQVERGRGLRIIGEQLIGIGDLTQKAFSSYLQTQLIRNRIMTENMLEAKLASNRDKPERWKVKIREIIAELHRVIETDARIIPTDLKSELSGVEALRYTQRALGWYGRLLVAWENLAFEAQELKTL